MKSRTMLIIAALAAFAMLAGLTAIAGANVQRTNEATWAGTEAAAGDPAPDKVPPGTGYPGVYAARDSHVIDPSVYPAVGGQDTFTWEELEPVEGAPNWRRLDDFITEQTLRGKKAAIAITTYNGRSEDGLVVPDWFRNNNPAALMTCVVNQVSTQIPRYWNDAYLKKYGNFVTLLANHLGSTATVSYVQIGVGLYGETRPADDVDAACIKAAMDSDFGFTSDAQRSAKWVEIVKLIIYRWGTAFNHRQRLFLVYVPRFIDICEKQQLAAYAAGTWGIGLFAGGIYADTLYALSVPPGGNGCQKWDPIVAWNSSLTATIPVAMESYGYLLPNSTLFYWGVLSALNKHADYLSLESDLFFSGGNPANPISENLTWMRLANTYLGKTAASAPDAWIAMRETSPASNGYGCNLSYFGAQYGDYDYWLHRDDTVAGGHTITASTIATYTITTSSCGTVGTVVNNPYYVSMLDGKGPQGWTTRRTDHARGNDYMYFSVDDAFVSGQPLTSTALITVTYFDNGADAWQLQWRNASGLDKNTPVSKTNTNQWKTQTFTVQDISFSGQYSNTNDFRIYNGGSGDEYIHMVKISKLPPIPPATRTPTPTRTWTPTRSPTATATLARFRVYLPVIMTGLSAPTPTATATPTLPTATATATATPYFAGPDEVEPNNSPLEANGPIVSGRAYRGRPNNENDRYDYFKMYVTSATTITVHVQMSTEPVDQDMQLSLYYGSTLVGHSGVLRDWDIVYPAPGGEARAGWYYIRVFTAEGYRVPTTVYTLRATFP